MGRYRYADTEVIDGRRLGTFSLPVYAAGLKNLDLLEGVRTFEHVYARGDRLDKLAAKYWNEDSYWWLIALVNGIKYPFSSGGLTYGTVLKIPSDPKDIFEKIFK